VTALQALDSLNKHGSLDNILKALGNKWAKKIKRGLQK
jgi:hypothetical protein